MKNRIKYEIKNLNREKIFKQITQKCQVFDIYFLDEKISFCVSQKHKKFVDKILDKNNAKVFDKKQIGTVSFFKSSVLRLGVLIASLLFCIVFILSNFFVLSYKVIGNELVETAQVLSVLKEQNIFGIKPKSQIDTFKLETELQKLKHVSFVSVIVHGNTLVVNIKEKVYNPEYEDKGEFEYIYSEFDGIITEITPVQGTVLVSVGQTIKKGQKLVAPYVVDTSGQTLNVKPMADIKADVFYTTTDSYPDTFVEMKDTGNVLIQKQILLFNLPIYQDKPTCDFKIFRTEEKIEQLSYGLILPIKVQKTIFYEQKQNVIENYFSNNKQQILEDCFQKTRQLVKDYEIIKDEYQTITSVAGINRVTTTVVVNKSILK